MAELGSWLPPHFALPGDLLLLTNIGHTNARNEIFQTFRQRAVITRRQAPLYVPRSWVTPVLPAAVQPHNERRNDIHRILVLSLYRLYRLSSHSTLIFSLDAGRLHSVLNSSGGSGLWCSGTVTRDTIVNIRLFRPAGHCTSRSIGGADHIVIGVACDFRVVGK